jgi:hypothetical protein
MDMKRIITFLLALSATVGVFAQGMFDDDAIDVVIDGLNYMLYEDKGEAIVAGYNCWDGELTIPSEVSNGDKTYSVGGINWAAFNECETLTRVVIPKSIHYIWSVRVNAVEAKNPFAYCTSLESIKVETGSPLFSSVDGVLFDAEQKTLCCFPAGRQQTTYTVPDGVESLAFSVFSGNTYLESVYFPFSVSFISSVFDGCTNLKTVQLPEGLEHITALTFWNCKSLATIDIPATVKNIGEHAFWGCSSLTSLDLPASVTQVGSGAFSECSSLSKLIIRGVLNTQYDNLRNTLSGLDPSVTVIYVQASEVEKYKAIYSGTVLPLESLPQDTYHPFLKEGKRWNYVHEHINMWEDERTTENVSFVIEGDMEIDGKTYKKMYHATSDEQFSSLDNKTFYAAVREEGKKVYIYDEYEGDILLFDFGMQPGESYELENLFVSLELTSIRQMTFHGRELTVMQYKVGGDMGYFGFEPIVESVGCTNGWDILDQYMPVPPNGIIDHNIFQSCYEDGECIFTAEDFLGITTSIQSKSTAKGIKPDGTIYDLQGRPLSIPPAKGLYIQNGRKYIRK